MAPFRVVIVDDQVDIRRMLHAGIETLGTDFQVYSMPSAEEALLEASRKPVDLLITDFRLPGMTGVELMTKMKRRCPDMKVFLVTGLTDQKVRKEVAEAHPDDFFIKPLSLGLILDAIKQTLVKTISLETAKPVDTPVVITPQVTLQSRLIALCEELHALTVALVDRQGKIVADAGPLPLGITTSFVPVFISVYEPGEGLVGELNPNEARSFMVFQAKSFHLFAAYAGNSRALITVTDVPPAAGFLDSAIQSIFKTLEQIKQSELSVAMEEKPGQVVGEEKSLERPSPLQKQEEVMGTVPAGKTSSTADTNLPNGEYSQAEEMFKQIPQVDLDAQQVDDFWDSALDQEEIERAVRPAAISYEEARKLGLAPKDPEETDY